jgi:DNA replication protein DnaC
MLSKQTMDKLHELRLAAMAAAWEEQAADPKSAALSFDERFGILVQAEHTTRHNRRLHTLLKKAELRLPEACVEDLDASAARGFDKPLVRQLTTCAWISEHTNVLITGATGVGKSYVGCALGQMACRRGHRVAYRRLPRMFEELGLARADGTYTKKLAQLAKLDLLVLDDFGIGRLRDTQRYDLLEILEDRYGNRSTVLASQLPIEDWHAWIGEPTIADAILDRLVHNSYKIKLKGPSRRKEKTTTEE